MIEGLYVNFICESEHDDIYKQSKAMLERTAKKGGFSLGLGNSGPEYIQNEKFFAMIYVPLNLS